MIPYGRHSINQNDIDAVVDVLQSGYLTQGERVQEFEQALATYVGAKYAVAVSSGTSALHLACVAAEISSGDNVVTSANTFVASANCARFVGADVHFTDIGSDSLNMDVHVLHSLCRDLTNVAAIIPVHFAGAPCDMEGIESIAETYGATVIEDCCHALGSSYPDGTRVGSCTRSTMSVFSFHPVKAIAAGEGGAITTNDVNIYNHLLRLRSHGINKNDDSFLNSHLSNDAGDVNPWYYEMQELGYNYRITDIQCALLLSQLKKLDGFVDRRRSIAARYDYAFKDNLYVEPTQIDVREFSAIHIYVLRISFKKIKFTRREFMLSLREKGIGTQVHYIPVPSQPYYSQFGFDMANYPNCNSYYNEALSIPVFVELTDSEQNYVVDSILELLE